jgi:hypothetical protein
VGFPIRKSPGQWLFAPLRSLSQLIASFIAGRCQGIPRVPLFTSNYHLRSFKEQDPLFRRDPSPDSNTRSRKLAARDNPRRVAPKRFFIARCVLKNMQEAKSPDSVFRENSEDRSTLSVLAFDACTHKEYGSPEKEHLGR